MATHLISSNCVFGVGGSSTLTITPPTSGVYSIGDIAYSRWSALRGKIEKVAVRDVLVLKEANQNFFYYKDSLNSVWYETDLIDRALADELILSYDLRQLC